MKSHFFVKLIPPRPTFHLDMTADEAALMQAHAAYWSELMKQGAVQAFGPVMDADGVYGMGIANAESSEEPQAFRAKGPVASPMTAKISLVRAVLPSWRDSIFADVKPEVTEDRLNVIDRERVLPGAAVTSTCPVPRQSTSSGLC